MSTLIILLAILCVSLVCAIFALEKIKIKILSVIAATILIMTAILSVLGMLTIFAMKETAKAIPEKQQYIEYMLQNEDKLTVSEKYDLYDKITSFNKDAAFLNHYPKFSGIDEEIPTFQYELK